MYEKRSNGLWEPATNDNYKMDKIKELEIRLDGILERRSRDLCLQELFNFAKGRFDYYHDMLKGKEVLKLDEILSPDGKAINEEAIHFYMVKQYAGYCEYLNEGMSDLNKEYEEIALQIGYFESNNDKKPWFKNL